MHFNYCSWKLHTSWVHQKSFLERPPYLQQNSVSFLRIYRPAAAAFPKRTHLNIRAYPLPTASHVSSIAANPRQRRPTIGATDLVGGFRVELVTLPTVSLPLVRGASYTDYHTIFHQVYRAGRYWSLVHYLPRVHRKNSRYRKSNQFLVTGTSFLIINQALDHYLMKSKDRTCRS